MDFPSRNLSELKYQLLSNPGSQMDEDDTSAVEVYLSFLRVARDLLAALQTNLERYELSDGKLSILLLLRTSPDYSLTPSELAERVGVSRGTITGLLDGLERSKLIKRDAHPEDRRMLTINLTTKGLDLLNQVLPEHYRRIKELMANFNKADCQQLLVLLEKFNQGIPAFRDA